MVDIRSVEIIEPAREGRCNDGGGVDRVEGKLEDRPALFRCPVEPDLVAEVEVPAGDQQRIEKKEHKVADLAEREERAALTVKAAEHVGDDEQKVQNDNGQKQPLTARMRRVFGGLPAHSDIDEGEQRGRIETDADVDAEPECEHVFPPTGRMEARSAPHRRSLAAKSDKMTE